MFKMGRPFAILRYCSPPVFQYFDTGQSGVDHRLYGQGHSRFQARTLSCLPVIRYLRCLMQIATDTMPDEFTDNAETSRFYPRLNSVRNI
jgi:hypothetical protein